MAYGDVGGPVTTLVITCKTPATGTVNIQRGDAVKLIGPYEIGNTFEAGDRLLGQALTDCTVNNFAVPVRVRGICAFRYAGLAPAVDGISGAVGSGAGLVEVSDDENAAGLAMKVNSEQGTVEVLL